MKANRKFIETKAGVSAVIGVILMVTITVAISATLYVYLSGMIGITSESEYFYGTLSDISYIDENSVSITLDNTTRIISFDRYADEYYSFTIGNYYIFRVAVDDSVTLAIEINE